MADRDRTVAEVEEELKAHVAKRGRLRELREKVKHDLFMDAEEQATRLATIDTSLATCSTAIEELMDERAEAQEVEANMTVLDEMLEGKP